jgi:hypothetical protein
MSRRFRWLVTVSACTLIAALSLGPAAAADTKGLSDATGQVAEGARSIGYGEVGSGVADVVVGSGRTVVEGIVFTGKTIGEFFKKTFGG